MCEWSGGVARRSANGPRGLRHQRCNVFWRRYLDRRTFGRIGGAMALRQLFGSRARNGMWQRGQLTPSQ